MGRARRWRKDPAAHWTFFVRRYARKARRQVARPENACAHLVGLAEASRDVLEPLLHRTIGAVEDPAPLFGEDVIDEPPVGDDGPALDETTGNEAVDHCGDRRRTHGQPFGQVGGDGRSLVEETEHPVLGERQIDGPEADLDLLAEPGGGPPEGPAPASAAPGSSTRARPAGVVPATAPCGGGGGRLCRLGGRSARFVRWAHS